MSRRGLGVAAALALLVLAAVIAVLGVLHVHPAVLLVWLVLAVVLIVWLAIVAHRPARACRVCGCTDDDCSACVEATGTSCWWVGENLCSRCVPAAHPAPLLLVEDRPGRHRPREPDPQTAIAYVRDAVAQDRHVVTTAAAAAVLAELDAARSSSTFRKDHP